MAESPTSPGARPPTPLVSPGSNADGGNNGAGSPVSPVVLTPPGSDGTGEQGCTGCSHACEHDREVAYLRKQLSKTQKQLARANADNAELRHHFAKVNAAPKLDWADEMSESNTGTSNAAPEGSGNAEFRAQLNAQQAQVAAIMQASLPHGNAANSNADFERLKAEIERLKAEIAGLKTESAKWQNVVHILSDTGLPTANQPPGSVNPHVPFSVSPDGQSGNSSPQRRIPPAIPKRKPNVLAATNGNVTQPPQTATPTPHRNAPRQTPPTAAGNRNVAPTQQTATPTTNGNVAPTQQTTAAAANGNASRQTPPTAAATANGNVAPTQQTATATANGNDPQAQQTAAANGNNPPTQQTAAAEDGWTTVPYTRAGQAVPETVKKAAQRYVASIQGNLSEIGYTSIRPSNVTSDHDLAIQKIIRRFLANEPDTWFTHKQGGVLLINWKKHEEILSLVGPEICRYLGSLPELLVTASRGFAIYSRLRTQIIDWLKQLAFNTKSRKIQGKDYRFGLFTSSELVKLAKSIRMCTCPYGFNCISLQTSSPCTAGGQHFGADSIADFVTSCLQQLPKEWRLAQCEDVESMLGVIFSHVKSGILNKKWKQWLFINGRPSNTEAALFKCWDPDCTKYACGFGKHHYGCPSSSEPNDY